MKLYRVGTYLCAALLVAAFAGEARAQQFEFHGYGGGIFPGDYRDQFDFKRQVVWGGKFLGYLSDRIGLEGNVGYLNHFEFDLTDPKSRGLIWEVNTNLNFFGARGSVAEFAPFITLGVGGITALVPDGDPRLPGDDSVVILPENHPEGDNGIKPPPVTPPTTTPPPTFPSPTALILEDGDTFFAFNYGGGLKRNKLFGPVGLRADFLGRTMPNFFGNALTWFEMTGGINFSWGER